MRNFLKNIASGSMDEDGGKLYEMAGTGKILALTHAGFVDSGIWDDQW
jgi:2-hydroxy-6-oxonona-2,4-dienedioate hydrolase